MSPLLCSVSYCKTAWLPPLPVSTTVAWGQGALSAPTAPPPIDSPCSLLPRCSGHERVFSLISVTGSEKVRLGKGWNPLPSPRAALPSLPPSHASCISRCGCIWRISELCALPALDRPVCALVHSWQGGGPVEPDSAYGDDTLYLHERASWVGPLNCSWWSLHLCFSGTVIQQSCKNLHSSLWLPSTWYFF